MYLDFFKLREFPFSITPDPKYLYFGASHRSAFDHLIFGITQRKGFIEFTGEVGCGKSTLCRAVLDELGTSIKSALILNPCLNGPQLLRAIITDFGIEVARRDRFSQLQALNEFLLEQARADINVVLIIDEAQDLPPRTLEEVRLLSNLETTQQKLIQIVLSGQPELQRRLALPELRQLRQRITVRFHIKPLATGETAAYIAHRLQTAEAPRSLHFDEAAAAAVERHAQGVPRMINAICDYALLAGYMRSTHTIDATCVQQAIDQLEGRMA